jgi:LmbE family N-acetylglucosaminyl deacetylase
MHITDLRQIHDVYDRIYLSPHLDDAALSCGGAIAAAASDGARVLVVTLCTAIPPASGPFSALAQEFHGQWALPPEAVVTARLAEDERAMMLLGVDWYWAGLQDAIYRMPERYTSRDTLFATPAAGDPLYAAARRLLAALHDRAPRARFYAPLGIGSHVDHLITFDVARAADLPAPVAFYEDVPYALAPEKVERRASQLPERRVPQVVPIAATLPRKLDAVAAYASQLAELFGGEAAMRTRLTAYAEGILPGGGERLWLCG